MRQLPAYGIISAIFFFLIGIGLAYSYFFYPDTHPLNCMIRASTGKDCPACGFSRSFSYYTHFKLSEGKRFNPLSWPVFLFFAFQFLVRAGVVLWYLIRRRAPARAFMVSDAIISISLFLLAFLPVILKF